MDLLQKLTILADAAKYDAACTSSGVDRAARPGGIGAVMAAGCCHSFAADGRCITLLKVLQSNPAATIAATASTAAATTRPAPPLLRGSWPISPCSFTGGIISKGFFFPAA